MSLFETIGKKLIAYIPMGQKPNGLYSPLQTNADGELKVDTEISITGGVTVNDVKTVSPDGGTTKLYTLSDANGQPLVKTVNSSDVVINPATEDKQDTINTSITSTNTKLDTVNSNLGSLSTEATVSDISDKATLNFLDKAVLSPMLSLTVRGNNLKYLDFSEDTATVGNNSQVIVVHSSGTTSNHIMDNSYIWVATNSFDGVNYRIRIRNENKIKGSDVADYIATFLPTVGNFKVFGVIDEVSVNTDELEGKIDTSNTHLSDIKTSVQLIDDTIDSDPLDYNASLKVIQTKITVKNSDDGTIHILDGKNGKPRTVSTSILNYDYFTPETLSLEVTKVVTGSSTTYYSFKCPANYYGKTFIIYRADSGVMNAYDIWQTIGHSGEGIVINDSCRIKGGMGNDYTNYSTVIGDIHILLKEESVSDVRLQEATELNGWRSYDQLHKQFRKDHFPYLVKKVFEERNKYLQLSCGSFVRRGDGTHLGNGDVPIDNSDSDTWCEDSYFYSQGGNGNGGSIYFEVTDSYTSLLDTTKHYICLAPLNWGKNIARYLSSVYYGELYYNGSTSKWIIVLFNNTSINKIAPFPPMLNTSNGQATGAYVNYNLGQGIIVIDDELYSHFQYNGYSYTLNNTDIDIISDLGITKIIKNIYITNVTNGAFRVNATYIDGTTYTVDVPIGKVFAIENKPMKGLILGNGSVNSTADIVIST